MIAHIVGTVEERAGDAVVVATAGGMGLLVQVPRTTADGLPPRGQAVRLYTHLIVREDQWQLCGFLTEDERDVFLALLAVNGVGARVALNVVGHVGPEGVRRAVREGRWQRLREAPGVGPKLAQRMLVELKNWAGVDPDEEPGAAAAAPAAAATDEVVDGLVAMGLSEAEARAAVAGLESLPPVERLRTALRRLDRGRGVG